VPQPTIDSASRGHTDRRTLGGVTESPAEGRSRPAY
jgi:hypothetical protein